MNRILSVKGIINKLPMMATDIEGRQTGHEVQNRIALAETVHWMNQREYRTANRLEVRERHFNVISECVNGEARTHASSIENWRTLRSCRSGQRAGASMLSENI